jgi:hypothetical protein
VFDLLQRETVAGVEEVGGPAGRRTYRRTLRLPYGTGIVAVDERAGNPGGASAVHPGGWLDARLHLTDLWDLTTAVQRLRRLFDLDADPYAVDERLGADPRLAPLIVAPLLLFFLPASLPRTQNASDPAHQTNVLTGLFGQGQAAITLFLWTATFGTLLVMYLFLNLMPSLLGAMGLSKPQAQYTQMLYNVGSSIGAAAGGYLLDKKLLYSTPIAAYGGLALLLAVFGFAALPFQAAMFAACGLAVSGHEPHALLDRHLTHPDLLRDLDHARNLHGLARAPVHFIRVETVEVGDDGPDQCLRRGREFQPQDLGKLGLGRGRHR